MNTRATSASVTKNIAIIGGALLSICALVLVASVARSDDAPSAADPASSGRIAPIHQLTSDQSSDFAALSDSRGVMPEMTKSLLEEPSVDIDRYGLNLGLAAAVNTTVSGEPIWIIPGRTGICLFITDPVDGGGISCTTNAQACAGQLSIAMKPGDGQKGETVLVGLVPNSVKTASVERGRGHSPTTAHVAANLWSVRGTDLDSVTIRVNGRDHVIMAP